MATTVLDCPAPRGRQEGERDDPVARERRQILGELASGEPRSLTELPRRWPLTREHLAYLVDRLAAEGLVEYLPNGTPPARRVRITAAGRRAASEPGPVR